MPSRYIARVVGLVFSMGVLTTVSYARDIDDAPTQRSIGVARPSAASPSLAVLNSSTATLEDGKLILKGVSPSTIVFADRPVRAAGHVLTTEFLKQWSVGKDSFSQDPPNATISVLGEDGNTIDDAVVELRNPSFSGDSLNFDVAVLEGDLKGASGPASLFIDWFSPRQGYQPAPAWRGGWYGHRHHGFGAGLALGALAGGALGAVYNHIGSYNAPRPYYGPPVYGAPPCGYYPYPECY